MEIHVLAMKSSWNWFEAQELCKQHNDSLPKPRTSSSKAGEYWSSQYRRYSYWIKILGCYKDTHPNDTDNFQMYIPSAGFCQEICAARNSSIFGVKQSECKCFGKIPLEHPVSLNYCTTEQTTGGIKFAEYGSANAYTLYESDFNVTRRDAIYCLAVQCGQGKQFFFVPWENCSLPYKAVCQNSVSGSFQNWTSSMELCKTGYSSYLAGNVSLDDVDETCDRFNVTLISQSWLGVAGEVYTGYDIGVSVTANERKSFLQCFKCVGEDCGYLVECKEKLTTVYCEKGFNIGASNPVTVTVQPGKTSEHFTSTNEPETTQSATHTSEASTKFINFISTHFSSDQDVNNSSDTLSIILPLVVSIIVIGGLVMAVVFYMRRKKGQENHNAKPLNSKGIDNGYTDIDIDGENKNYFLLEQQSEKNHNESHVNYTYDSNSYTDTAEGVYDHLRDKESRKRREDDENLRDSNPHKDIAEGIYDHLKDKESRKINKGGGQVMDSNPYKETEGGVYDHLREKETGKFTEENNYDHTPATAGKEYCAQGGMNEQSTDTAYDHAMSFFDYKQHDQVIEEADGGYAKTVNIS